MTETKHTPHWRLGPHGELQTARGDYSLERLPGSPSIGKVEDTANRRMIAAAPDLLSALELLEAAAIADGWPDGWGLVKERMERAIVKAKKGE